MKANAHIDDSMRNHTWCDVGVFAAVMVVLSFGIGARAEGADGAASAGSQVFTTVQELYNNCIASQLSYTTVSSLSNCRGYIGGVVEMMMVIGAAPDAAQRIFGMCPKDAVTQGAVTQVFKNWAEKHPEMWSKPRVLGVMTALQEAWPCN